MSPKAKKRLLCIIAFLMIPSFVLCGCAPAATSSSDSSTDTNDTTQSGTQIPDPDPNYPADKYKILSKEEYLDKTTAGFLGQLAGFLSGYEFKTLPDGKRCRVGMPDNWFEYLKGPYAGNTAHMKQTDKHIKNKDTGLYEVWFDDDFSVDVVNQYIIADMYKQKYTLCQKYVSEGWLKYDVWDMGGGQRKVGAYGLINRFNYLPQFAGNTEYDNWYSYCTEAYLGTDMLGMNAPGMPSTASELSAMFAQVTGDRDNLQWAQMFTTMISLAYFENDIPTLIKESSKVFPEGSYPLTAIDYLFELYEKYPDDWRTAYKELEAHYYIHDTRNTNTSINCSFVILDLLYGKGDYMETCKIGSLAGYDCESTCGIALTVIGVMGGTSILPEETNTLVWQDGKGVLTNISIGEDEGIWMIANSLPRRIKMTSVLDKYRSNFESILLERGGAMDDYYYYIPTETLGEYDSVKIQNPEFETGNFDGYTTTGTAVIDTTYPTKGLYTAKLQNNAEIYTKVSNLQVGKTYAFSAFVRTDADSTAYLVARDIGGSNAVCASVHKTFGTQKYIAQSTVKRTLVFVATAAEMEIGIKFIGTGEQYAFADSLSLVRIEEKQAGTVTINNKTDDGKYTSTVSMKIDSKTNKEAYLKLTFANPNTAVTRIPLNLNGESYMSAALYKTCDSDGMKNIDVVYIPMVLVEGNNNLEISLSNQTVSILSAEFVNLQSKF